jgi:hypothetical protein
MDIIMKMIVMKIVLDTHYKACHNITMENKKEKKVHDGTKILVCGAGFPAHGACGEKTKHFYIHEGRWKCQVCGGYTTGIDENGKFTSRELDSMP